jgi:UDP-GlcNAc:undecaprenyl-phosphate GlcNAc-1-phosphate transferase
MISIGALLLAFAVSVAATPVVIRVATGYGFVSRPKADRWNARAIPLMGGVALYLGVTSAVLSFAELGQEMVGVILGGTLIFVLGIIDDVLQIKPSSKFLGQILAACVVIYAGLKFDLIPNPFLNLFLTLLWLVGITNAFNLLDNMDGLSAGVALVASAVLLINAWLLGEFFISLVLLAFMGSLLGFLWYNWNPASIFLGDCGSLFIGYVLASLTLLERYVSHASSSYFPILMPVLVLAVPLLDTTTVMVIRLREGRPIYVGDRRHLSHRLVALGLTPKAAVLVIYLITFCLGLGAASLADATVGETALILLQSAAFVALIVILMFFERREAPAPAPPDKAAT